MAKQRFIWTLKCLTNCSDYDDTKTTTKAASSNDTENTQTASEDQRWLEQLSRPVLQSIKYYSDPTNIGKAQREDVHSWIAAGISEVKLSKFSSIASKIGVISHKHQPSPEGFGIEELHLVSFKPSSKKKFKKLRKRAGRLGLEMWQEINVEIGATGPINTGTIQEGTFVENLNDADTATDVNGDGTTDPLWHLLPSDSANAQYGVNATGAWNSVSGEDVNVGVFDELFDLNHSDLNSAMPTNFDWNGDGNNDGVDSNADGMPDVFEDEHFTLAGGDIDWPVVPGGDRAQSHGTSVAGIALVESMDNLASGSLQNQTLCQMDFSKMEICGHQVIIMEWPMSLITAGVATLGSVD